MDEARVRRLEPQDSLHELTALLHLAYAPLAAQGFRFLATHQSVDVTRERCESGECWVAEAGGRLIGTVTFRRADQTGGCPHYDLPHVASFGQLAVHPAFQGAGLGESLVRLAERRARETGARELALDTAEGAAGLVRFYERLGFEKVGEADWRPLTNYRSVILSKRLR